MSPSVPSVCVSQAVSEVEGGREEEEEEEKALTD